MFGMATLLRRTGVTRKAVFRELMVMSGTGRLAAIRLSVRGGAKFTVDPGDLH